MEEKSSLKNLLKDEERPYDCNTTDEPSLHNTMGMLRIKLEEAKKENEILKAMLTQVNEHCTVLQNRILFEMQQNQLSSSVINKNNNHESQGKIQDVEKPMLHTRQFLNIGDCSSLSEGYTEKVEKKILGRSLACEKNNIVEGEMNTKIALHEAKCIEDQASEVTCRRAKVSIRARSDFSLVQRCFKDETVLITTYEGSHNHPLPTAARSLASSTSAALNMFLSGSLSSSVGTTTLPNSPLFSSSLSSVSPTAVATFSHSATCPTVTLDLTQPNNNNNNYLQFQRATTSHPFFPLPLHDHPHHGLPLLCSKVPTFLSPDNNLALVDVVSQAITKDPSLKAALFSAISSLTGDSQKNSNNRTPNTGYDPCSKMPAILPPHHPCSTELI